MRYYLKKLISQHPTITILIIGVILSVILSKVFKPIGTACAVITGIIVFLGFIYFLACKEQPDDKIDSCFDVFRKKTAQNWNVYEKKYRNNKKILNDVYNFKIEELEEKVNEVRKIPYDIDIKDAREMYSKMMICHKWFSYLKKEPMELKKAANKKIINKMNEIQENAEKLKEYKGGFTEEVLNRNIEIIKNDMELLGSEMRKVMGIETEFQSVFEEVSEKNSLKQLIPVVQSLLEGNSEFEETLEKLKLIERLIPNQNFPAKLRIVLEDIIIHADTFKQLNNQYQNEIQELVDKLNQYLDHVLEGKIDATVMEEVATIRALKEFIS